MDSAMTGTQEHDDRDQSRDELLAVDVPAILAAGISDGSGAMRGPVQGTASAAAAVQLGEDGLPVEMLGRILTMIHRHTLAAARANQDVIVEEPAKRGFPRAAAIVRLGIEACRDDADYILFARWLANVYGLLVLGAADPATDPGPAIGAADPGPAVPGS